LSNTATAIWRRRSCPGDLHWPDDFNTQLGLWLRLANGRVKRSLGCAPADRVDADRLAMLALPPVPPQVGWSQTLRLVDPVRAKVCLSCRT